MTTSDLFQGQLFKVNLWLQTQSQTSGGAQLSGAPLQSPT